jgi:hypothetical protein
VTKSWRDISAHTDHTQLQAHAVVYEIYPLFENWGLCLQVLRCGFSAWYSADQAIKCNRLETERDSCNVQHKLCSNENDTQNRKIASQKYWSFQTRCDCQTVDWEAVWVCNQHMYTIYLLPAYIKQRTNSLYSWSVRRSSSISVEV